MEVCVQGALLPESTATVSTAAAVKEEKLTVRVFPSTSQDIKPVLKGDAHTESRCFRFRKHVPLTVALFRRFPHTNFQSNVPKALSLTKLL